MNDPSSISFVNTINDYDEMKKIISKENTSAISLEVLSFCTYLSIKYCYLAEQRFTLHLTAIFTSGNDSWCILSSFRLKNNLAKQIFTMTL
jgi:hypothetical protein